MKKSILLKFSIFTTVMFLSLFSVMSNHAFADTGWTAQMGSGARSWSAIASNASGTKVVAGAAGDYLYISNDSGNTWTPQTSLGTQNWNSIVMNASGTKIVVVDNPGTVSTSYVYISNDGGNTWATSSLGADRWSSVSMNVSGSKIVAATTLSYGGVNGYVYISNDGGNTWATSTSLGVNNWNSIAMNASGTKIAVSNDTYVQISNDGGNTWATSTSPASLLLNHLAMNPSGTEIVGSDQGSYGNNGWSNIYFHISNDGGNTWATSSSLGTLGFITGIQYSPDGSTLGITTLNSTSYDNGTSSLYTSTNNGSSWSNSINFNGPATTCSSLSSNGSNIFVAPYNNYIYTYGTITQVPTLIMSPATIVSSSSLVFSAFENTNAYTEGFQYGPTTSYGNNVSIGTSTVGNFTATATSLTKGLYHYRAFATNAQGTTFSPDYSIILDYRQWSQLTGAPNNSWNSIVSNASGTKILAGYGNGYLSISNDGGNTWATSTSLGKSIYSFAMNASGTEIAATNGNAYSAGYLYISNDGGTTWATSTGAGINNWKSITVNASGTKLVATTNSNSNGNSYIYISNDGGNTWATSTSLGQNVVWSSIAMNASGTEILATEPGAYAGFYGGGYIHISNDGGNTWATSTGAQKTGWWSIASSADGLHLVASSVGGTLGGAGVYTSTDGGVNWKQNASVSISNASYSYVASSASGEAQFVTTNPNGNSGNIYTYYNSNPQAIGLSITGQ